MAMPVIRCPHCGARNLAITGWANLDTCADCGRPLATRGLREIEAEVRQQLYGRADRSPPKRTKPDSE
jgi:hypothetical protein